MKILKKNIFPCLIEVNLDKNGVIKKDIEEIKNIINIIKNNKQIDEVIKDFSNMNIKKTSQENSNKNINFVN